MARLRCLQGADAVTNTIGISFFLQNSVMLDLTDGVIGYTPFYVTNAPLATTAQRPTDRDRRERAAGTRGVVSGPGGIVLRPGAPSSSAPPTPIPAPTAIAGASEGVRPGCS